MRRLLILIIFLVSLLPPNHLAEAGGEDLFQSLRQNVLELQKTVRSLQQTVQSQNEVLRQQAIQISDLQKGNESAVPRPSAGQAVLPAEAPKSVGGFNPDTGVIGTVQTKLTQSKEDAEGNDTIALKELELNFGQAVDPYSRLDATISFNDDLEEQNANIEEAYYTRWGLPLGFTGQIGKFRAKIGKQNLMHLHTLPTGNYPLVIRDFFGEEGLAASGVRLQNHIPNPWDLPFEVTGEVLRGNNGPSFSGVSRRPIFNTHVKTFFEPSQDANLELGWTTMFGDENPPLRILNDDGTTTMETRPEGTDRYGVKVFGADVTFNWFLPEGKKVQLQNEIYFQNRTDLVHVNSHPWGFYSQLDYRFSPRFCAGIRFDYLSPLDVSDRHGSTEVSPYLIFWQSEYADLKLQYSHVNPAGNGNKVDNAVFITVDFLIGAHQHAIQ
ncbi:MAG TPA: hypothetical protein PKL97_05315 [Candidatus Omnitrophota bacterium]|nr:hypothetical protein [Candidatus Omnitrophota bacterium]